MPEIRFGIQHAPHRAVPYSAQKMINCYLEGPTPGSRSPAAVVPSYGIREFTALTPIRGLKAPVDGVLYVQTDDTLYSIDSAGLATSIASINAPSDALIEGDGTNVVVTTAGEGYVWNGSTLQNIRSDVDTDYPVPAWMGYVDGYFPTIAEGTGQFFINETAFSVSSWNALDFTTAAGAPDDLLWGLVVKRELLMFGRDSLEIYYNSGNADFPFTRIPNGFIDIGIMSKYAAGEIFDVAFWMGNDGLAYQLNGYVPVPISSPAMAQAVEDYTRECRVLTWFEGNHPMVAFRFPEGCWVYDLSTKLWHQRRTYGRSTWNVDVMGNAYGKWLCGAHDTTLGRLDGARFQEYGDIMRSQCTSAAVYEKNNLVHHDRLELCFDTGGGGEIMLEFSDDGGRTWSNERTASLGAQGKYESRVVFSRLGAARDRVYQYAVSDAVRRTLLSANLNEWG